MVFSLRKRYEAVRRYADETLDQMKEESDARREYVKKNGWDTDEFSEFRDILEKNGISIFSFESDHEFNSQRWNINSKLNKFEMFTRDLHERDLTEANFNAYTCSEASLRPYFASIAFDNWIRAKKFKKAKELFDEFTKKTKRNIIIS